PVQQIPNNQANENPEQRTLQSTDSESMASSPTAKLLQARSSLTRQGQTPPKKPEPAESAKAKPASSALERLVAVAEQRPQSYIPKTQEPKPIKKEAYRWRATNAYVEEKQSPVTTPKAIKAALEHEKTAELAVKLVVESIQRDSWAAEIDKLNIPK
ncbi:DNA polymerase III subunit gamma/tau, partial [Xenorhabdus bovienii]|uniref:DNA polymerase III subunit gamma/tau C-terminal domain-containing protein n=1 Tax=Xenorhabdus bovienii TaxID=40576 RepID=UPI0030B9AE5F|nr:DNA polymerase III subunit gamma/tau [Xenorhabdus bovienii]